VKFAKYWPIPLFIIQIFILIELVIIIFEPPWFCTLPDLRVDDYTTSSTMGVNGMIYDIDVTVINDGRTKSGWFLVYCNAITYTPYSGQNEIRAQQSWRVEELQPGETAICSFSFGQRRLFDERVDYIEILVDAKGMVAECYENNNMEWWHYE